VSSPKRKILIIEDEPHIIMGLTDALEFEGFAVVSANRGREGVNLARQEKPDAILLDLMLPDTNGFRVCEELRRWDAFVPIVMLTARNQEIDKIRGLDAGADDYITKPFGVGELIARMRAILRRARRPTDSVVEIIRLGDAEVNLTSHAVVRGGQAQQLTFYEVELLRLLLEKVNQPVSRDEILQKIWGLDAAPSNRTVDNFIVKLRKKVEKTPDKPECILTVYGYGYKMVQGQPV
jgi:DNA-binding response OmpR family regulator